MTKKELLNLDIRVLSEKAQRIFEESDQNAINDFFGKCESIDDINRAAEDLYSEIFGGGEA